LNRCFRNTFAWRNSQSAWRQDQLFSWRDLLFCMEKTDVYRGSTPRLCWSLRVPFSQALLSWHTSSSAMKKYNMGTHIQPEPTRSSRPLGLHPSCYSSSDMFGSFWRLQAEPSAFRKCEASQCGAGRLNLAYPVTASIVPGALPSNRLFTNRNASCFFRAARSIRAFRASRAPGFGSCTRS